MFSIQLVVKVVYNRRIGQQADILPFSSNLTMIVSFGSLVGPLIVVGFTEEATSIVVRLPNNCVPADKTLISPPAADNGVMRKHGLHYNHFPSAYILIHT